MALAVARRSGDGLRAPTHTGAGLCLLSASTAKDPEGKKAVELSALKPCKAEAYLYDTWCFELPTQDLIDGMPSDQWGNYTWIDAEGNVRRPSPPGWVGAGHAGSPWSADRGSCPRVVRAAFKFPVRSPSTAPPTEPLIPRRQRRRDEVQVARPQQERRGKRRRVHRVAL